MKAQHEDIYNKLKQYRQKFYLNLLLRGFLLFLIVGVSTFTLVNVLEFFGKFNTFLRAFLFFSFIGIVCFGIYFWLTEPLLRLFQLRKPISDEEAAQRIGSHFSSIDDKLLNTLQLSQRKGESSLLDASLEQKQLQLAPYDFKEVVQYKENRKYLKYLIPIFFLVLGIGIFVPDLFKEGSTRLINYDQHFESKAPFGFSLNQEDLKTFKGEDLVVKLSITGNEIPNSVTLLTDNGRKLKMSKISDREYTYTFTQVQAGFSFHFEAAGFGSNQFEVQVYERPNLNKFNAYLQYPAYTNRPAERVENTGNLVVPDGTKISWSFETQQAEEVSLWFEGETQAFIAEKKDANLHEFSKAIRKSATYKVGLKNKHSANKEPIEYFINVIPDEYPQLEVEKYQDSVLHAYVLLGGSISDDYGISQLNMKFRKLDKDAKDKDNKSPFQTRALPFNKSFVNQGFYQRIDLQDFNLKDGEVLEYYIEVWDNDRVNGSKSTKSTLFTVKMPSEADIKEDIENASNKAENQMNSALDKAEKLNKQMEEVQERLKGKEKLSWQDKKAIEDLIQRHNELKNDIENVQKLNEELNNKQERFSKQDSILAEKAKMLEKLMDEMLDEETLKMYEELQKLLEKEKIDSKFRELMKNLEMKEENVENELDKALEMFKQMKFDNKLNEIQNDLEKLAKEQEELSEETKDAKKEDLNDIKEEQKEIDQKFEDIKEDMKELEELNKDLEKPNDMQNFDQMQKDVNQEQQNAKQNLDNNKQNQASQNQKNAANKMKQMQQQMASMQQQMAMEQQMEDYNALRKILENLVKLSFDQEQIMKDFRTVKQSDPKFITISQQQLKIKDDAKIVEDSLIALAKRVFEIQPFVTREVALMNKYIEESVDIVKKRDPSVSTLAPAKQQMAMTSINNLALMLNDVLSQMQQNMSGQMGGTQNNQKGNKNKGQSMGDMQQMLNQQIQQLQKSGKSGPALSKELAKLAAQQEMIRNAMKEMMKKQGMQNGKDGKNGGGLDGGNMSKMLEEMKKTEEDLVNKRLTEELVKRQQDILTRLLESEKAMRERDLDKEREAKSAKEKEQTTPPNFSDYFKTKEQQIELLKTVPTTLTPYYKKEVDDYFKKLKK